MKSKKGLIFGIIYGIVLCGFTVFALLDTFVIRHVYSSAVNTSTQTGSNMPDNSSINGNDSSNGKTGSSDSSSSVYNSNPGTVSTSDSSYSDDNISINLTEYRENNTSIYVADVVVSHPDYLKTAFAEDSYGRNITAKTSVTAAANNAILAINGDYYGAQTSGYVIRNGQLYRSNAVSDNEDLVIYQDGSFEFIKESEVTASDLLSNGARQVLSFGPALISDSSICVSSSDEVDKAMSSNPRTAIGIIDKNHYVFVVSDGRSSESTGLSLYELATFLKKLGVTNAYNLDGGGSSTMYFNGKVINNPTTNGKKITERSVSDIVYIGY